MTPSLYRLIRSIQGHNFEEIAKAIISGSPYSLSCRLRGQAGQSHRINVSTDLDSLGQQSIKNPRVTVRYSTEMFDHVVYTEYR